MFAVSNSCVNPLVYGSYVLNFKDMFKRCFCRRSCSSNESIANTQVTTAARRMPASEPVQRATSVHLNLNNVGTYTEVAKTNDSLLPSNLEKCRFTRSCGRLSMKDRCEVDLKTEAVVHSLHRWTHSVVAHFSPIAFLCTRRIMQKIWTLYCLKRIGLSIMLFLL